ncbi:RNA 2',3'-cyclic phosphodiesterase [Desulforamulus hydrothermalis]|uniref:RNA 2',3'-cyclic phosphodiesterase n=1 Tax=Desulforamulus hydrothermalis Lam5 = DSM 18033 TaxID=1121428 RepID=K8EBQ6_9FIRM|nr:RNA 2',3'-cyclic phosphodiesterase [Desulforamulus hydrothermalis]CCO09113.1 2'-5' RNA ligase [Desulforamulus hydrothermalis Lam5 = DSM 18033]SHH12333.1 2'-5' RNA ligase [Desulforamulus hydrothermalis Lam5 = DSM 18033]
MKALRLFIAVRLPDSIKQRLAAVQAVLRQTGAAVKWVEQHQFHLTLKFLGETPPPQVPAIVEAIRTCGAAAAPFELSLGSLGVFPDRGKPRVIWAGLGGNRQALTALQACLEQQLMPLGFPPENRPYTPHLTLGRFRQPGADAELLGQMARHKHSLQGEWQVADLHLMQSVLTPRGPVYTILAAVPLHSPGLSSSNPA